jgi:hypothetical protein
MARRGMARRGKELIKTTGVNKMATKSEEYLKLCTYVTSKPDGFHLYYDIVQQETGLSMAPDSGNRNKLARAIHAVGRRALIFPSVGYELDDTRNTERIVDKAGQRVFRQIKRSSKTTKVVTTRHYEFMPQDAQARLSTIGRLYGYLERKTTNFEEIEIKTIKEIPTPDFDARK